MECNIWNEQGLLYTSEELSEAEVKTFKAHLEQCTICQQELDQYRKEKEAWFSPEMLEETPSLEVGKEIVRLCSNPVKPTSSFLLFPAYVKNLFYALVVLAVGFGGGAYYTGVRFAAKAEKEEGTVVKMAGKGNETLAPINRDASNDSSAEENDTLINRRNEIPLQGVIPVNQEDE